MDGTQLLFYLICIAVGLGYLLVMDLKANTKLSPNKYLAVVLCFAIALASTWLGGLQSVIGGPMIGLFIGMLLVNMIPSFSKEFKEGTTFAGKKYLNLGIILVGGTLNFAAILPAAKALPLIIFNIVLSLAVAYLVGRRAMGLSQNTCTLVGGGTAICGGSAIATLASVIKAKEAEIAYAMTAIFLFDILGALVYPYLADALSLTARQFGFLAGCAINDTSSVVASQATYVARHPELDGYDLAMIVKLVRATMLIFVAIFFTAWQIRKETKSKEDHTSASVLATVRKAFPWFILVFFIMALMNTLGLFDLIPFAALFFKYGNKFFITCALAGVGFKIKFRDLFTNGVKPVILGGCTWICVALASLGFVVLFASIL